MHSGKFMTETILQKIAVNLFFFFAGKNEATHTFATRTGFTGRQKESRKELSTAAIPVQVYISTRLENIMKRKIQL